MYTYDRCMQCCTLYIDLLYLKASGRYIYHTWVLWGVVGHRPSYGRGTKCVFLGFCCVDATQVMGVMGWGGGDGNVP